MHRADLGEATCRGSRSPYGASAGGRNLSHACWKMLDSNVDSAGQQLPGDVNDAFTWIVRSVHAQVVSAAADAVPRGCRLAQGAAELAEYDNMGLPEASSKPLRQISRSRPADDFGESHWDRPPAYYSDC